MATETQVTRTPQFLGVRTTRTQEPALLATPDTGATFLAVFAGVGVTLLLLLAGVATGLVAVDANTGTDEIATIATGVGIWAVIAGLIGAFVGGFVGGRSSSMLGRVTPFVHAGAAWGLTSIAVLFALTLAGFNLISTTVMASSNTAGLVSGDVLDDTAADISAVTGLTVGESEALLEGNLEAADLDESVVVASNESGDAMWWLVGWLALALAGTIGGWWIGAGMRHPASITRADERVANDPRSIG